MEGDKNMVKTKGKRKINKIKIIENAKTFAAVHTHTHTQGIVI